MSAGKYRIFALSVLLMVLVVNIIFAGTTGKIAGRIVDKETGEPLVGVNVVVKGTTLGASTNVDGYYSILYVPPGIQTVVVSIIGYSPVTVTKVRVLIDQTAPINIEMVPQAIETGVVIVEAERNIVKRDVSTSISSVQSDEIASLPVSSVSEVVNLQAGIEDGMVIRGGSSDQLLFQIDGVSQRDPRNNMPISQVPLTSVQEVSIEKGGFNAEYGQVQSGVVNIVAKEGSLTGYTAALQVKYAPPQQKFFGMSVYDPNSMYNRVFLDPNVCWTGTANPVDVTTWNKYTARQYPDFLGWNYYSQQTLQDPDPSKHLSPAACQRLWEYQHRRRPTTDQPDYNIDASLGGLVPFVSKALGNLRFFTGYREDREMFMVPLSRDDYEEFNWFLKVNSDINSSTKLMLTSSVGRFFTSATNFEAPHTTDPSFFAFGAAGIPWQTQYFRTPLDIAGQLGDQRASEIFTNSWDSGVKVDNTAVAGKLAKLLSASSFYEIGIEYLNRRYNTNPVAPMDTARTYQLFPGYYVNSAPFGYDPLLESGEGDSNFFFGGHSSETRDTSRVSSYKLKFDFVTQATNEHLIKFGFEITDFDLNLNYANVIPAVGNAIYKFHYKPIQLSAYMQDKIEVYGFIANVGLRMDISDPNTKWVSIDPFDAAYYSTNYQSTNQFPMKQANVDFSLSPRLGISHPITENSKLYFNYGHFKQLPSYEQVFVVGRGSSGALTNAGDPNLAQAKTIAYELGYDHVLFNSILLQVQAFYRDISSQPTTVTYSSDVKGIGYTLSTNNAYSDIRGFELTLRKTTGDWFRGFATYTYQVATNGQFGEQTISDNPAIQRQIDDNTQSLYQTQPVPQPHARAALTFLTPRDFGPNSMGLQPLGDWSLTLLGDWRSGKSVNYNPNNVAQYVNIPNVKCADYYNVDLRLVKTFSFKFLDLSLLMEVKNLFNSKFLSGIFYNGSFNPAQGDAGDYIKSLHLPASNAYDNIPGNDRVGDYRKDGVAFQPIEQVNIADIRNNIASAERNYPGAIFWDTNSGSYWKIDNTSNTVVRVPDNEKNKILDDKAYIDMPNITSINFLNPRQVFFGLNLSFKF